MGADVSSKTSQVASVGFVRTVKLWKMNGQDVGDVMKYEF